eukprot:3394509-Rhodomonas_salina.1
MGAAWTSAHPLRSSSASAGSSSVAALDPSPRSPTHFSKPASSSLKSTAREAGTTICSGLCCSSTRRPTTLRTCVRGPGLASRLSGWQARSWP